MSLERTGIANPPLGEFDESILCAECDGQLGKIDEYALAVIRNFDEAHVTVAEREFEMPKFDSSDFIRFTIAVLWRASISRRPAFSAVGLGRYETIARDVAFGCCGIANFPQFRMLLTRPHSQYDIDPADFLTYPKRSAFAGGFVSYQFALGGFRIIAIIDSRPLPAGLDRYLLRTDTPLKGIFQTFEDTPEFRAMRDMVVADAIRRGVPPWEIDVRRSRSR